MDCKQYTRYDHCLNECPELVWAVPGKITSTVTLGKNARMDFYPLHVIELQSRSFIDIFMEPKPSSTPSLTSFEELNSSLEKHCHLANL